MNIPEYLLSQGYIAHRRTWNGKEWENKPCEYDGQYSTMVSGGLFFVFIKDGHHVYYGLNEKGLPPTLISPRPEISSDHVMNRILEKFSPEEIIDLINMK